jgi:hypothetical protein
MIPDVKFIDASNWDEQTWLSSGGSRAKKILKDESGKTWFFKCSEKKEAKDGKPAKYYMYEFWSEIIAYQLGKAFGLDVLRYDPASINGEIGAISRSMIDTENEQLLEVGRFMTSLNQDFIPALYKKRNEYTFQLLDQTLNYYDLTKYWENILKVIVFDAIIGNTDRHQENLAFIGESTFLSKSVDSIEAEINRDSTWFWKKIELFIYKRLFDKDTKKLSKLGEELKLTFMNISRFSPIYDSGSSLARELDDDKVAELLSDSIKLEKYCNNGLSEIHWMGSKISHFDFISELLSSSYLESLQNEALFIKNIDNQLVRSIVYNIDISLPSSLSIYKIPENRKELIIKLVILRVDAIKKLIYERV